MAQAPANLRLAYAKLCLALACVLSQPGRLGYIFDGLIGDPFLSRGEMGDRFSLPDHPEPV